MPFPGLANILIGDTVIDPRKRFPSSNFTANVIKRQSTKRSQTGKLFVQVLYQKYEVVVNGLNGNLFDDLRGEFERNDFIDLSMIVNRKEFFTGTGSQTVFLTSRRFRLDDLVNVGVIVEHPVGTVITAFTLLNLTTQGQVTFTVAPSAGSNNIVIRYFPIIKGVMTQFDSGYDWVQGEEDWSFTFFEE